MGPMKWVMSTARENMGKMVCGMILSVCCVVFNVVSPILYARVIDDVIDGGQSGMLGPLCIGCIVCSVLFVLCTYSSQFLLELGSQNTERDLRKQLYAKQSGHKGSYNPKELLYLRILLRHQYLHWKILFYNRPNDE